MGVRGVTLLTLLHPNPTPPWGSKGLLNRAGEALRNHRDLTREEMLAIETWRWAHTKVLNTFQAILRNRTKGTGIVVAQRLKRRHTIVDKLFREPRMQLARMDDVAGCRLIFSDIPALVKFRNSLHKARFNHQRKNSTEKYDYILHPKHTGYRGIHDIYEYNPKSKQGQPYAGLLIELQFRTQAQHAWATAVEVVSTITENQPKFERGDERYREFFRLTSEIIARTQEESYSTYKHLSSPELIERFDALDAEIHLIRMLRGLHTVYEGPVNGGNFILHFSADGRLQIHEPANADDAATEYFRLEKANPKDDIVLVNADTFAEIRSAYRNYFSDPQDFLRLVDAGHRILGGEGCL